jgi:photosystem II stability/assembly factor-like uncharacterized protein
MWRAGIVVVLLLGCGLPAEARAGTVQGYRAVGPPAPLGALAFAGDGTIYGTVDAGSLAVASSNPVALWRSSDHGATWSAVYRMPDGSHLNVAEVSPADPGTVYAYAIEAIRGVQRSVVRIDVRRNRAVPLPFGVLLGVDAAGTAYGRQEQPAGPALIRCPVTADGCERVPGAPAFATHAVVDPLSRDVLAAASTTDNVTSLESSTDGGATWAQGVRLEYGGVVFGGPSPRTLYSRTREEVYVSHNAGLTWSDAHPVSALVPIIAGSHPSAVFNNGTGSSALVTTDEGASFHELAQPVPGQLVVDPSDADRIFVLAGDATLLTSDGGRTWRDIADARFGSIAFDPQHTAASGRYVYATGSSSLWTSSDMGLTWTRTQRAANEAEGRPVVSRDDPRIAYISTTLNFASGEIRTLDGGAGWQAITPPPSNGMVTWITPTDPSHIYAAGSDQLLYQSLDAGATWTPADYGRGCAFTALPDAASPTGVRLRCGGYLDPLAPLPVPPPYAPELFGSPDDPGRYAVIGSGYPGSPLVGDLRGDWSWTSMLGPTGGFGPAAGQGYGTGAWPNLAGTTFFAADGKALWVRRGAGRWWRLAPAGRYAYVLSVLDATHVLVAPPDQNGMLGVVDLSHPPVAPPVVEAGRGVLTCTLPWTAADADTTALAWLRDGAPVPGAVSAQFHSAAADAGHELACRATVRTDFGSSIVTSDAAALPPAALALAGSARAGSVLRCGARSHVTWLRDGRGVKGRHAQTYRIARGDSGHSLACQARRADGGLARSRAVLVGDPG